MITTHYRTYVGLSVVCIALLMGCSKASSEKEDDEKPAATTTVMTKPSIPDPHGTYKDAEGGVELTFLATGTFYQDLMGEMMNGTWQRNGNEVELTYDDGSSIDVTLGNGYVLYSGMRLSR